MPTSSSSQESAPDLVPALVQLVFDAIMGDIEEDLTSRRIHRLSELYPSETPDEAAVRKERYRKAYVRFDQEYAVFLHNLRLELNPEISARLSHELKQKAADDQASQDLLNSISQA